MAGTVARPLMLNADLHVGENTEFLPRVVHGVCTLKAQTSDTSADLTLYFRDAAKVRELRDALGVLEQALTEQPAAPTVEDAVAAVFEVQ